MSNQELQETFAYCQQAHDPEQWTMLAMVYYARGYFMNALCCFRLADECAVRELAEAQGC